MRPKLIISCASFLTSQLSYFFLCHSNHAKFCYPGKLASRDIGESELGQHNSGLGTGKTSAGDSHCELII